MNGDSSDKSHITNGDFSIFSVYLNGDLRNIILESEYYRYMSKTVFNRKIYNEILEWKEKQSDKYALLFKGARRIGKSTIAVEFVKNEFKSYIVIDFTHTR